MHRLLEVARREKPSVASHPQRCATSSYWKGSAPSVVFGRLADVGGCRSVPTQNYALRCLEFVHLFTSGASGFVEWGQITVGTAAPIKGAAVARRQSNVGDATSSVARRCSRSAWSPRRCNRLSRSVAWQSSEPQRKPWNKADNDYGNRQR